MRKFSNCGGCLAEVLLPVASQLVMLLPWNPLYPLPDRIFRPHYLIVLAVDPELRQANVLAKGIWSQATWEQAATGRSYQLLI